MKTFEGSQIREATSDIDDTRVIFPMYLLRGISVTLILMLFFYIVDRLLNFFGPEFRFEDFILSNLLVSIAMPLFLFLLQALFFTYQVRRKVSVKRSRSEIIMSYALPLIGIIAAVYTAYTIGVL